MSTALVIHGHFYQPPRENPWTGGVDREPSAGPDHDWNERIHRECYRPNAFARIVDEFGRVVRIQSNYSLLSFNFGPTLLSWLQAHDPATYSRIQEADRLGAARTGGRGNALAQGFNHAILPLCNPRDRLTQIRWGKADFRHRFGREPEALWLPETACDGATLGALIDEGMRFALLAPTQALRVRRLGEEEWHVVEDGSIDPGLPYRWSHPDGSGRSLALFFYDAPMSRAVAFEGALGSSRALVDRLERGQGGPGRLIHIATDGESYGHHTHFGERGLAHALSFEAPRRGFEVTAYGAFLDDNAPQWEVELKPGPNGEGTAWSCSHGLGRWTRDCGCTNGAQEGWNQAWRTPLRAALNLLRDAATAIFEDSPRRLFADPWAARDAYVEVMLGGDEVRDAWLGSHCPHATGTRERERALLLLEMQRNAQLMFTSCGWFFADVSGLEAVQVLKYAGRVLDLMEDLGVASPRERFLEALGTAKSNLAEQGTGADVFRRYVDPLQVAPARVAAHIAVLGLVDAEEQGAPQPEEKGSPESEEKGEAAGYRFVRSSARRQHHGRLTLATARIEIEERATERCHDFAVAALHLGGVDFYCVARPFQGALRFAAASDRIWAHFRTASLPALLATAADAFGPDSWGLESLLPEGRHRISQLVFADLVGGFAEAYTRLFETNQRVLEMLQDAGLELPGELVAAAEYTFGLRFEEALRRVRGSRDPAAYARAVAIAQEAEQRGFDIDRQPARRRFSTLLAEAVTSAVEDPTALETALAMARLARKLHLEASFERAQELLFLALERDPSQGAPLQPLARELGLAFTPPPTPAGEASAAG